MDSISEQPQHASGSGSGGASGGGAASRLSSLFSSVLHPGSAGGGRGGDASNLLGGAGASLQDDANSRPTSPHLTPAAALAASSLPPARLGSSSPSQPRKRFGTGFSSRKRGAVDVENDDGDRDEGDFYIPYRGPITPPPPPSPLPASVAASAPVASLDHAAAAAGSNTQSADAAFLPAPQVGQSFTTAVLEAGYTQSPPIPSVPLAETATSVGGSGGATTRETAGGSRSARARTASSGKGRRPGSGGEAAPRRAAAAPGQARGLLRGLGIGDTAVGQDERASPSDAVSNAPPFALRSVGGGYGSSRRGGASGGSGGVGHRRATSSVEERIGSFYTSNPASATFQSSQATSSSTAQDVSMSGVGGAAAAVTTASSLDGTNPQPVVAPSSPEQRARAMLGFGLPTAYVHAPRGGGGGGGVGAAGGTTRAVPPESSPRTAMASGLPAAMRVDLYPRDYPEPPVLRDPGAVAWPRYFAHTRNNAPAGAGAAPAGGAGGGALQFPASYSSSASSGAGGTWTSTSSTSFSHRPALFAAPQQQHQQQQSYHQSASQHRNHRTGTASSFSSAEMDMSATSAVGTHRSASSSVTSLRPSLYTPAKSNAGSVRGRSSQDVMSRASGAGRSSGRRGHFDSSAAAAAATSVPDLRLQRSEPAPAVLGESVATTASDASVEGESSFVTGTPGRAGASPSMRRAERPLPTLAPPTVRNDATGSLAHALNPKAPLSPIAASSSPGDSSHQPGSTDPAAAAAIGATLLGEARTGSALSARRNYRLLRQLQLEELSAHDWSVSGWHDASSGCERVLMPRPRLSTRRSRSNSENVDPRTVLYGLPPELLAQLFGDDEDDDGEVDASEDVERLQNVDDEEEDERGRRARRRARGSGAAAGAKPLPRKRTSSQPEPRTRRGEATELMRRRAAEEPLPASLGRRAEADLDRLNRAAERRSVEPRPALFHHRMPPEPPPSKRSEEARPRDTPSSLSQRIATPSSDGFASPVPDVETVLAEGRLLDEERERWRREFLRSFDGVRRRAFERERRRRRISGARTTIGAQSDREELEGETTDEEGGVRAAVRRKQLPLRGTRSSPQLRSDAVRFAEEPRRGRRGGDEEKDDDGGEPKDPPSPDVPTSCRPFFLGRQHHSVSAIDLRSQAYAADLRGGRGGDGGAGVLEDSADVEVVEPTSRWSTLSLPKKRFRLSAQSAFSGFSVGVVGNRAKSHQRSSSAQLRSSKSFDQAVAATKDGAPPIRLHAESATRGIRGAPIVGRSTPVPIEELRGFAPGEKYRPQLAADPPVAVIAPQRRGEGEKRGSTSREGKDLPSRPPRSQAGDAAQHASQHSTTTVLAAIQEPALASSPGRSQRSSRSTRRRGLSSVSSASDLDRFGVAYSTPRPNLMASSSEEFPPAQGRQPVATSYQRPRDASDLRVLIKTGGQSASSSGHSDEWPEEASVYLTAAAATRAASSKVSSRRQRRGSASSASAPRRGENSPPSTSHEPTVAYGRKTPPTPQRSSSLGRKARSQLTGEGSAESSVGERSGGVADDAAAADAAASRESRRRSLGMNTAARAFPHVGDPQWRGYELGEQRQQGQPSQHESLPVPPRKGRVVSTSSSSDAAAAARRGSVGVGQAGSDRSRVASTSSSSGGGRGSGGGVVHASSSGTSTSFSAKATTAATTEPFGTPFTEDYGFIVPETSDAASPRDATPPMKGASARITASTDGAVPASTSAFFGAATVASTDAARRRSSSSSKMSPPSEPAGDERRGPTSDTRGGPSTDLGGAAGSGGGISYSSATTRRMRSSGSDSSLSQRSFPTREVWTTDDRGDESFRELFLRRPMATDGDDDEEADADDGSISPAAQRVRQVQRQLGPSVGVSRDSGTLAPPDAQSPSKSSSSSEGHRLDVPQGRSSTSTRTSAVGSASRASSAAEVEVPGTRLRDDDDDDVDEENAETPRPARFGFRGAPTSSSRSGTGAEGATPRQGGEDDQAEVAAQQQQQATATSSGGVYRGAMASKRDSETVARLLQPHLSSTSSFSQTSATTESTLRAAAQGRTASRTSPASSSSVATTPPAQAAMVGGGPVGAGGRLGRLDQRPELVGSPDSQDSLQAETGVYDDEAVVVPGSMTSLSASMRTARTHADSGGEGSERSSVSPAIFISEEDLGFYAGGGAVSEERTADLADGGGFPTVEDPIRRRNLAEQPDVERATASTTPTTALVAHESRFSTDYSRSEEGSESGVESVVDRNSWPQPPAATTTSPSSSSAAAAGTASPHQQTRRFRR